MCPKLDRKVLARNMQIIFQDPYGSLDPRITVGGIIGEGLEVHGIGTPEERNDQIREIMDIVGISSHYAQRYPHEFSGGQRQRIGIARSLVLRPQFLVCDEPVSALDVSIQSQILNLLRDLQGEFGLTYLFIAHNLAVVRYVCDRVAVMYLGKIVEQANTPELFGNAIHPYTRALMDAIPVPDPSEQRERLIIPGELPSPTNPPQGCRFNTRCAVAQDVCFNEEPPLRDYGNGHFVACHVADDFDRRGTALPQLSSEMHDAITDSVRELDDRLGSIAAHAVRGLRRDHDTTALQDEFDPLQGVEIAQRVFAHGHQIGRRSGLQAADVRMQTKRLRRDLRAREQRVDGLHGLGHQPEFDRVLVTVRHLRAAGRVGAERQPRAGRVGPSQRTNLVGVGAPAVIAGGEGPRPERRNEIHAALDDEAERVLGNVVAVLDGVDPAQHRPTHAFVTHGVRRHTQSPGVRLLHNGLHSATLYVGISPQAASPRPVVVPILMTLEPSRMQRCTAWRQASTPSAGRTQRHDGSMPNQGPPVRAMA